MALDWQTFFYERPKSPTSGRAERTWFTQAKQVLGASAAAATAPVIAASGVVSTLGRIAAPILGRTATKAAKSAADFTIQHPIKAIQIGGISTIGGIVGYNAIKENPKIVSQGVPATISALKDVGTTAGEVSKSKTFGEMYGHLRSFVEEHPVASGIGAGAVVAAGGAVGANLVSGALTRQKLEEVKQAVAAGGGYIDVPYQASGAVASSPSPQSQGFSIVPDTTKKAVVRRSPRSRKPQKLNTTPINIRNYNIMSIRGHHG